MLVTLLVPAFPAFAFAQTTTTLAIDTLTATYPADRDNTNATSNAIQYRVQGPGKTSTVVSLAVKNAGATVTSISVGTPATLTATVTAGGTPVTSGTIIFCDTIIAAICFGPGELGAAQLTANGTASLTVRLGLGSHSLQAQFEGTQSLAAGISSQSSFAVTGQSATTVTILPAIDHENVALSVEVSAVAPMSAGAITGSATLEDQSESNLVLLTGPLSSQGVRSLPFTVSPTSPATGTRPFSIASADFNHDGSLDLVVANSADNNVGVLLGKGDGTFNTQLTYGTGAGPFAVATGDFNNDGNPDIAVANFTDGTVSILLGNGDGTFKAQTSYAVGKGPAAIVVGDFNCDGTLDLAVANEKDNTVSILIGNRDGTFQAQQTFATGNGPDAVAVGDFNNDGSIDLVVANNADGTVGVLLNNGDGTFQPVVPYTVGTSPVSIAVADFNNDGILDMAVANLSSDNVSVLFGKVDGTFGTQTSYSTGANSRPSAVVAGNLSGLGVNDGYADLAVAGSTANTVTELFNEGDAGAFSAVRGDGPYPTGTGPLSLVLGDWNGDGLVDIAAANNTAGTVSVLLNGDGPGAFLVADSMPLPGKHTLIATYTGDTNFGASTSSPTEVDTPQEQTTLTLSAPGSTNPSDYGQPITLVATLSPYSAGVLSTDGELVAFTDGSTTLGTAPLSSGVATLNLSDLPTGVDSIKAVYTKDAAFEGATSQTLTQTVRPATLTVTAANAARVYGAANPAFTGTVSGAVNGDTFTVTGTTTATPTSPPGAYPVTPAATGTHIANYTVKAVNGTLTVKQATPAVALSASADEVYTATAVTFTAKVTSSGSGAGPTGEVKFYDGTTLLGTESLSAGVAAYETASLAGGKHSITAAYAGDTNFITLTSSTLNEVIVSGFTVAPASGASSSATASPGGKATYSLTLSPPSNATFPDSVSLAVAGLPAGATATFSPSTIAAGKGATNVTLTIALPASTAAMSGKETFKGLQLTVALGLILLPLAGLRKTPRWKGMAGLVVVFATGAALAVAVIGCGSSKKSQPQPQNYTLTVTATSGGLSQNTTLELTEE